MRMQKAKSKTFRWLYFEFSVLKRERGKERDRKPPQKSHTNSDKISFSHTKYIS